MPDMIRDGAGSGWNASVSNANNKGRLNVSSRSSRRIHYGALGGNAYSIYGARTFDAADTDEGILFFSYTGIGSFYIDYLMVTGNGSANQIELFVDSTYGSGGTAVVPVNMNRGSAKSLSCTAVNGVSELTVTPGDNEVADVRFGVDFVNILFDGCLILPPNTNLYVVGSVGTIGDKIRATVLGWEE